MEVKQKKRESRSANGQSVDVTTHHADVEGVQKVKGQRGDQIHEQPGGDVVNADGASVVHHLTRRAHKRGPKVQQDVCRGRDTPETG